jgi:hypothetical protein
MLTARAITKARVSKATAACTSISIFARRERAMTSVGLNAVALVNDKLQIVNVSGFPIGRCQGRPSHLWELEIRIRRRKPITTNRAAPVPFPVSGK